MARAKPAPGLEHQPWADKKAGGGERDVAGRGEEQEREALGNFRLTRGRPAR
jgi:hypothetical protein